MKISCIRQKKNEKENDKKVAGKQYHMLKAAI